MNARPMLRLAWRDVIRNPGRSILVIIMIALPVFALSATDLVVRTMQLSDTQQQLRDLSSAQATATLTAGSVLQGPTQDYARTATLPAHTVDDASRLMPHLPAGTNVQAVRNWTSDFAVPSADNESEGVSVWAIDYTSPVFRKSYRQQSGRAPKTADEVAISASQSKQLDISTGGTLSSTDGSRTYRVVGVVKDRYGDAAGPDVFVSPNAPLTPKATSPQTVWYVSGPHSINWNAVLGLNQAGYVVSSRYVLNHPPANSQVPYYRVNSVPDAGSGTNIKTSTVITIALVALMIVIEIVLLAGPAFAVGARRSRRTLALVSAVGGSRKDLRNLVLMSGVVLGVLAGVVGAVLGVLAGWAALPVVQRVSGSVPGPLDVRPLEILPLVLVSAVTGTLAAWMPARAAASTDPASVLHNRRLAVPSRKRVPLLGAAAVVAGSFLALVIAPRHASSAVPLLCGVIIAELGLVACVPVLLAGIGRVARFLPVSGRIALRDTARNRSSSAPAIAAIMAAVTGAVAVGIIVGSMDARDRRGYHPQAGRNSLIIGVATRSGTDNQVIAALAAAVPGADVAVLREVQPLVLKPGTTQYVLPSSNLGSYAAPAEISVNASGSTNYTVYLDGLGVPNIAVDDGTGISALLGYSSPMAAAALKAGTAVALSSDNYRDGHTSVEIGDTKGSTNHLEPAVLAPAAYPTPTIVIPPAMAAALHLRVTAVGYLTQPPRATTSAQQAAVHEVMRRYGLGRQLYIEKGYRDDSYRWGLLALLVAALVIALGSALTATALSSVDSRPDVLILGAIGASPRVRRRLAVGRAGVIAGAGTLLGTAFGFVAPLAYLAVFNRSRTFDALHPSIPWYPTVLGIVVLVPGSAILAAYVFTRSRLPSEA